MGFKKIWLNTEHYYESKFKNYVMQKIGLTKAITVSLYKIGLSKVIVMGILLLL